MENTTISAPIADTQASAAPTTKKVKAQKSITKMTNVKEFLAADSATIHSFDLADFPKGIGQMLNKVEGRAEFNFLGKKFNVPSLTANNSNPERAATIYKQLCANLFPANVERVAVLSQASEEGKVLMTLKGAGFKFKSLCKVEVAEAINLKIKNWRAKVNLHKETVRGLNAGLIAETNKITEVVKTMKVENLKAITGFESKVQKQLS